MKTIFPNEVKTPGIPPSPGHFLSHSITDDDVWTRIANGLRLSMPQQEFTNWIKPVTAAITGRNELTITVPNLVFYQTFQEDFLPLIDEQKNSFGLKDFEIHLTIAGHDTMAPAFAKGVYVQDHRPNSADLSPFPTESNPIGSDDQSYGPEESEPASGGFSRSLNRVPSQIDPAYTFSSFVRGPSNQFAVASCQNVAENPGMTYNPLFIYGHTGLGKTHLMHAVGNRVLELNPSAVVTYVRSEYFMNEMIHCIRHNKTWNFRQKYRHCDVLLVDDIQFISGNKKSTQEEFFHTFNALYESKKQIVITSDKFPQDIPDIEDRLRNRFQWGLIADIQPPDIEHRMAILFNKAETLGISLSDDVAEYIATHAKRNVRELEGALHRIHAFSTLHGRAIDLRLAAETFQNVLGDLPKRLTIEIIQKAIADHFKLKVADLKSKRRQRALTLPRQVAMYLSRHLTKASFPEIGAKFGGKDHSTVMHAVKVIDKLRAQDLDLKAHLDALERQLEQLS